MRRSASTVVRRSSSVSTGSGERSARGVNETLHGPRLHTGCAVHRHGHADEDAFGFVLLGKRDEALVVPAAAAALDHGERCGDDAQGVADSDADSSLADVEG